MQCPPDITLEVIAQVMHAFRFPPYYFFAMSKATLLTSLPPHKTGLKHSPFTLLIFCVEALKITLPKIVMPISD